MPTVESIQARALRAGLYGTLCQVQAKLYHDARDTPGCEAQLCSLMKATAPALLRYRRGARDVRDRLARIASVARLDDLEFMQRTLSFYLATPPARGWL